MRCILFGHRNAPESVLGTLRDVILSLVREGGECEFFVGNNGNFDYFSQCVLRDAHKSGVPLRYGIVLSFLGERALSGEQGATVFPEGLEQALPKFAISKRNEWLIKNADCAVVYVKNKISNCGKLLEKTLARGIRIIHIENLHIENRQ